MKAKHTANPWNLTFGDGKVNIVPEDGHGKIGTINIRRTKTNNIEEMEANAKLIASAPDLLKELFSIRLKLMDGEEPIRVCDIENVLEKAGYKF